MAKDFFNQEELTAIKEAVAEAEMQTSGEIRLHLENHCKEEVLDRAAYLFEQLEMHKTQLRNGVLFYLAIKDHQFAILGDVGINQNVPEGFWDEIRNQMRELFKQEKYKEALIHGILESGKQLKAFFPLEADDQNELSDEISFGQ